MLVHLNALATLAVVPRLRTVYHPGPAGTFLYTAAFAQIGPRAREERADRQRAQFEARAAFWREPK